jgi:hypothetical protein
MEPRWLASLTHHSSHRRPQRVAWHLGVELDIGVAVQILKSNKLKHAKDTETTKNKWKNMLHLVHVHLSVLYRRRRWGRPFAAVPWRHGWISPPPSAKDRRSHDFATAVAHPSVRILAMGASSIPAFTSSWPQIIESQLFGWLLADGWCWFVLREEYCWLVAAGCGWLVRSKRKVPLHARARHIGAEAGGEQYNGTSPRAHRRWPACALPQGRPLRAATYCHVPAWSAHCGHPTCHYHGHGPELWKGATPGAWPPPPSTLPSTTLRRVGVGEMYSEEGAGTRDRGKKME